MESHRWHSSMRPAPNACDTSVSRPSSRPIAKIQTPMKTELPMPTAPIASGPILPTMRVSTRPIVIQPEFRDHHRHGERKHRTEFLTEIAQPEES